VGSWDDLLLCFLGQAQVRAINVDDALQLISECSRTPDDGAFLCAISGGKARQHRQIASRNNGARRMLHPLSPDRVRRIHGQPELRALVRLGKRVAAGAAGETALRANGEPLKGDILRRFIDAPLQAIDRFE